MQVEKLFVLLWISKLICWEMRMEQKPVELSWEKSEDLIKPIDGEAKSGGFPIPDRIAHRIGVDYPFPPHLQYASNSHFSLVCSCCPSAIYRTPSVPESFCLVFHKPNGDCLSDGNILTNIVNALIVVPHFYTQVGLVLNEASRIDQFLLQTPVVCSVFCVLVLY